MTLPNFSAFILTRFDWTSYIRNLRAKCLKSINVPWNTYQKTLRSPVQKPNLLTARPYSSNLRYNSANKSTCPVDTIQSASLRLALGAYRTVLKVISHPIPHISIFNSTFSSTTALLPYTFQQSHRSSIKTQSQQTFNTKFS